MLIFFLILPFLFLSCSETNSTLTSTKLAPPSNNQIYFGAFPDFGGNEENISIETIQKFETLAQKKIVWACFSNNWWHGITYPKTRIHTISASGVIPYVRLMPRSDDISNHTEQTFTLQKIIDGVFDESLKQWAKDAKSDGINLLVDFALEMNGDWFPWSGIFNGGSITTDYGDPLLADGPERYRDAYRHIITIFRELQVDNITWIFHYNYGTIPYEDWNKPANYYPGDSYIDWVGFSLYGAQTTNEVWDELAFSTILEDYIDDFCEINTTKPIALLEFGVTDNHPNGKKSVWLDDAFKTILSNPYIKFQAINPWHENWQNEDETWSRLRLDSSTEVEQTFKNWIKNERFISYPSKE